MNEHDTPGVVFSTPRFREALLPPARRQSSKSNREDNTLTGNSPTYAIYSLGTLISFFVSGKGERDLGKVYFPFKYPESYASIFPKLPK